MSPELLAAVKERLELGYTHDAIKDELRAAGHGEDAITMVLQQAHAEVHGTVSNIPAATQPEPSTEPTSPASTSEGAEGTRSARLPGVGELLSDALSFVTGRLDLVALLAAPYLVVAVLEYLTTTLPPAQADTMTIAVGFFTIAAALLYVLFFGALLYIVMRQPEEHVSFSEGFAWALTHFFGLIWLYILSGLVVWGGFILLIIPGIIVSVYLYMAQYAFVAEDMRGMQALRRSHELVSGYWWAIAGRLLGILLVTFGIVFLATFILAFAVYLVSTSPVVDFAFELISLLVNAAATIIGFHIGVTMYRELSAEKPVAETKSAQSSAGYTILAFIGLLLGGVLLFLAVAGVAMLGTARDDANNASLQVSLSTSRSMAEIYYNQPQNGFSYSGVCTEIEPLVAGSAKFSDCVDTADTWALTATSDATNEQYCVDYDTQVVRGGIDTDTGLCTNREPTGLEAGASAKERANELREQETTSTWQGGDGSAPESETAVSNFTTNLLAAKSLADMRYEMEGSYVGACAEVRSLLEDVSYTNCIESVSTWALTGRVAGSDTRYCVDSENPNVLEGYLVPGEDLCMFEETSLLPAP